MATTSTVSLPHGSPPMQSPSVTGLKKVLSKARRESDAQSDGGIQPLRTDSVDSLNLEKSPTRQSTHSSPSRDGSIKSGSSGMRKLVPGHSKRKRRKLREEELRNAAEELTRGREATISSAPPPLSRKASSLGSSSLLTDDSEAETAPPLVTRDSHTGYLTTSSPLIKSSTTPDLNEAAFENNNTLAHTQPLPSLIEPERPESSPSPKSPPLDNPSTSSLNLLDRADTLRPDSRRSSISKIRSKSPARKLRDVFSKSKSPRGSPERKSTAGFTSPLSSSTVLTADSEETSAASSLPNPVEPLKPAAKSMPALDIDPRPLTPPTALIATPVTTVTPPTPTDTRFDVPGSPKRSDTDSSNTTVKADNITVSPSGNMISHRRVRSTSSASHQPSKLSNSISAPLTPTLEETRTASGSSAAGGNGRTASGSFFSSWMTAAQTAATTFTNLTSQNRSRAGTNASEPSLKAVEPIKEESEADEPETPRKQLAVETMGSGDLNFEHLGLEQGGTNTPVKPSLMELRHDSVVARDVAAAKAEDVLAKRAVSAAYERQIDGTPVAEVPDPLNNLIHTSTLNSMATGQSTPPNGSILESEVGSIKRSNSVRSKLAKRRSRGSSVATGQSAIGALIGGSTATLANPATGPRLSGFSMAPKQRNRNFHQQFRSVPEDDYLVEDYSCALQKEILLAGRIYISEGHICFSSNILGWVTTLVISFEEVVNIEKENTALVIPNAIAIQTLHARHTFRSLLIREATYDLLLGIWKVSHPASFQKSLAGKQLVAEEATKSATGIGASDKGSEKASEGSTEEESDEDDEEDSAPSIIGSASVAGSDMVEAKTVSRKPSGMNGLAPAPISSAPLNGEMAATAPAAQGTGDAPQDFPGPATHAPTECTDSSTHYDIVIKDEVLPAPLGKIYSLLYGPQSSTFVRKFLVDECKSLDLQMEDDKKGLSNEKKSRQYTYIKPLGGSIGPKQTKCITTEDLDFFDLEKAVTVTCSTQTPDVPSGSAFVTKTRYCLTWAAGNATRFQMNCTIEWSAKSWLKGPIEKGAKDGQQQYGDSLVKMIKGQVGRARGLTTTSKLSKGKKKGKKSKKDKAEVEQKEEEKRQENWGLLEPLRGYLGPVVDFAKPVLKMEYAIAMLSLMVLIMWFSQPKVGSLSPYGGLNSGQRMAAYEEMWRKEESELWDWLEQRAGVDAVTLQQRNRPKAQKERGEQKERRKERQKVLKGKDMEARLREERMGEREMEEALRVTRERLEVLEEGMKKRRASVVGGETGR